MKTILLCTLALFLTAGSCKKNAENRLLPATQTGANTFGCLINGKSYTATRKLPGGMGPIFFGGVTYSLHSNNLEIYAVVDLKEGKSQKIWLNVNEFKEETKIYRDITLNDLSPYTDFDSYVKITRYDNYVISGTFQIKVKRSDGIFWEVTKGRFDISK